MLVQSSSIPASKGIPHRVVQGALGFTYRGEKMQLNRMEQEALLDDIGKKYLNLTIVEIVARAVKGYKTRYGPHLDEEDEYQLLALASNRFPLRGFRCRDENIVFPSTTAGSSSSSSSSLTSNGAKKAIAIREEEKEQISRVIPIFSSTFSEHIFKGQNLSGTAAHTGIHSTIKLTKSAAGFPNLTGRVNDTSNGCFSAVVTYADKKNSKQSSFFPDDWKEEQVMAAVVDAVKDSWSRPSAYNTMKKGSLTWVGCHISSTNGIIFIGGRGSGRTNGDPVLTAYPAVDSKFT